MNKKFLFILFILFSILSVPASALDGVDWGIFEDYIISPNKYAFDKIFNITNRQCSVKNSKEKNTNTNKDDADILEDEIEKEKQILEEYLCPLIKKECLFFKKVYESLDKNAAIIINGKKQEQNYEK